MKNLISLALISLLIFGCKSQEEAQIVDLERNDQVSIFDLVDSISVVKLETNDQCLIKNIDKIIPFENRLYIFDSRLNIVFCFDQDGKYLFKINKKGRGPDEYENATFVNIDRYNNLIMILVPWGYLHYYDLNGNFISKIELSKEIVAYNEVYAINKDTLLFISFNQLRASYYSISEKRILKRFLEVSQEQLYSIHPINKTYIYRDSLYYNDNSKECSVLNLSNENNPVVFKWSFGQYNNKQRQFRKIYYSQFDKKTKRRKSTISFEKLMGMLNNYPSTSIETEKFQCISMIFKSSEKFIFFNKHKKNYVIFKETVEGVRPFGHLNYENLAFHVCNDKNALFLTNILSDRQKNIVESHDSEKENPFLVIYNLK
ncbi:MAG: hypothetical protein A2266_09990 [Bacteroidetes bacterium RIFOXYA12_FULL_40_10]|nr:MAG: hypothetical protein A2266_09990 [Bacteroidetes bacterium RIFOXYA12_FULL_40_10]